VFFGAGSGTLIAARTGFQHAACLLLILFALFVSDTAVAIHDKAAHIGLLAHREESLKLWSPTADYLTQ
jgi:hypothetical protein